MTEKSMQIKPYPLGAHCEGDGIRFSFVSKKKDCGILLYDRASGEEIERLPFEEANRIGNVHCAYVTKYKASDITYHFYEGDAIVPDRNAVLFVGECAYGEERAKESLKAGFPTETFDWQQDERPRISYRDCIGYQLHVRGFTKHASSKVEEAHRGTFRGVMEKIPYLRELGITTVELQPAYEFEEFPSKEERLRELSPYARMEDLNAFPPPKLNYWGYKRGYYYSPKASYATGNPVTEFKELVRELHKHGMEVVMQFYFPGEVSAMEIPEILRYWVSEYHVDGFHLIGEKLYSDMLGADAALADTKLWCEHFSTEVLYEREEWPKVPHLASYQENYLCDMRKFLRGDEDMVKATMYHMRHIPAKTGRIHYLTNYNGMTLMDMVSYERKHNEKNGEDNRDGNNYNHSWNCGEEGISHKKKVNDLRLRQMKNALCLLMFTQSTPLIFMGDEFGNSQLGNNNPYCQDNEIAWLNWMDLECNAELHVFWKQLVSIRKEHPIFHQEREPVGMDTLACGYPDLSYHGESAWNPETENYSRWLGIMYCGKYTKVNGAQDDDFFYIAMNMHWEEHTFGLPKLPEGMRWQSFLTTAVEAVEEDCQTEGVEAESVEAIGKVPARSVVIYIGVQI